MINKWDPFPLSHMKFKLGQEVSRWTLDGEREEQERRKVESAERKTEDWGSPLSEDERPFLSFPQEHNIQQESMAQRRARALACTRSRVQSSAPPPNINKQTQLPPPHKTNKRPHPRFRTRSQSRHVRGFAGASELSPAASAAHPCPGTSPSGGHRRSLAWGV